LGDEIGTLNDYGYHNDPVQKNDSRWVHRVKVDWERYDQRNAPASIEGRVFQGLRNLIRLRKKNNSFSNGDLHMIQTKNDHVLGFTRAGSIIFANFSEVPQLVSYRTIENMVGENHVRIHGASQFAYEKDLTIEPLDFLVIAHQVRG
jgi:amylosucrase